MRPAEALDAFLAAPAGRFLSGDNWLFYCVDERFYGQIYWGCPGAADVERLVACWDVERKPGSVPHVSLVDARQLQAVPADAFAVAARGVTEGLGAINGKLDRQAIVRPTGMTGALVTGFYGIVQPTYTVQVFDDVESALGWLGRPELAPLVAQLGERAPADDPMVRGLRRHLMHALRDATLPLSAKALGVSERTLQRRLKEAGTTFQDELQVARVREAERLLLDPERKLTAIAAEVGCASLQHFSALFRRINGLSPTEWRARRG